MIWPSIGGMGVAAGSPGLAPSRNPDRWRSSCSESRLSSPSSLDAWTTIAALAARTERIRRGTLVSPVTFRPPAVLAKAVVTAQEISGGRVELGMGAGWYAAEHDAYGFPFPPVGERMDELERQLEVVTRHWDADGHVWPKPSPRPRLVVGGSAKPRTVRAAVR